MIKRVLLDKTGLEMFVGPLEAKILRVLWDHDPITSNRVHREMINNGYAEAYTTIHTTLTRMLEKDLIGSKRIPNHKVTYWYARSDNETQFLLRCTQYVHDRLSEVWNA